MDILQEITNQTRTDLEIVQHKRPEPELREQAYAASKPPSFRDALKPVENNTPRIIAEIKRASPSKGIIRNNFGVISLGLELEQHGAAALSVLTETRYFQGSRVYLQSLAKAVNLPLLRKDFIVSPYQLYEAKVWGASAVLLIAAVLSPEEFERLHSTAEELGLAVLSEVHTATEMEMAIKYGAGIIGVNSRNLKTFETSLENTAQLLKQIPEGTTAVAESGIHTADDVKRLREAGADAFLIGESLMASENPGQTLERFLT